MLNSAQQRKPAVAIESDFSCDQIKPSKYVPTLQEDVSSGLLTKPRSLPPKYFYDEVGSDLFDQICDTKEYYPTRAESALLQEFAASIIELTTPSNIIELGSGTSRKTRHLLDMCEQQGLSPKYWPMDVCEPLLRDVAKDLMQAYPWLNVNALVGDYHGGFAHFPSIADSLYVFIGGTIGNFEHKQAVTLLSELRETMAEGCSLLLGFDRIKDSDVLQAAYNDAAGVTAAFNLNLLNVLNKDLEANFDAGGFRHTAIYNSEAQRIEMYLIAQQEQKVDILGMGETLHMYKDEKILTEISRKFTLESMTQLLDESGYRVDNHFEASQGFYSLVLASPA